jgi:hypothetical protein
VLLLAGILGLVLGKKPAAVAAGPAYPTGLPAEAPPGYPVQPYPPQQPPGQSYPPSSTHRSSTHRSSRRASRIHLSSTRLSVSTSRFALFLAKNLIGEDFDLPKFDLTECL